MPKLALTLAVVLGMVAVSAVASAHQYVLKHPKREHCRAHYVKKVERTKGRNETVCVYVQPKSAMRMPTFTLITDYGHLTEGPVPGHTSVSGSVMVVGGHGLIGVPITYTITNESSGQPLGSFTEPSDAVQPCALVLNIEGDTQTFAGESVPPEPACPINVSLPTGQLAVLTGSFAGNSTYAPSVSEGKGI